MPSKPLRAVGAAERRPEPMGLLDAVAAGDVLEMLLAQRRLIAEALVAAAENTRPQLNNELNKLHVLIAAEQERRDSKAQEAGTRARVGDQPFDATAI